MLALCVVQAVPVTAAPLAQAHVFWVHTRLDVDKQAVVSLVPVLQLDRHPVQALPFL